MNINDLTEITGLSKTMLKEKYYNDYWELFS